MASNATPTYLLFDLDGTLYPASHPYLKETRRKVFSFMNEYLDIPENKTEKIWKPLFKQYNQSLRGLKAAGYEFDAATYWNYIRAGAREYLDENTELADTLRSLPQVRDKKAWILTNCGEKEAIETLEALGIGPSTGIFAGVMGAETMGEYCKPEPEAFARAFARMGIDISDAPTVCFFEDSIKNLDYAKSIGMRTVAVVGKDFTTAREEKEDISVSVPAYSDQDHEKKNANDQKEGTEVPATGSNNAAGASGSPSGSGSLSNNNDQILNELRERFDGVLLEDGISSWALLEEAAPFLWTSPLNPSS